MSYSKNSPGQKALVIDWETTGANFGGDSSIDYQGISFGAIIADTQTWEEIESIHVMLHFDDTKYKWTEGAEKIHGMSREFLQQNGVSREEGLALLLQLLLKHFAPGSKILLVGHNAEFDRSFMYQLFKDNGLENALNLHHVMVDTSGIGFVLIGEYKSDVVFELLGQIEKRKEHNALDDARACLSSLRTAKNIFTAGLLCS